MSIIDIEAKGFSEIFAKLNSLPDKVAQKIERGSLRRALQPIFDSVVRLIPVGVTGNLADSVKIVTRTRRGRITGQVQVNAPHAHLVEYGHRMVDHAGKEVIVASTGTTRVDPSPTPRGFMRPSLDEQGPASIEILRREIEEAIEKLEVK